ncbi:Transcription elongation factor GreB [Cystobacter fuscus DSM 2262]|uniref:Transcription elongation factor GreB n=1 Tax=Cystobacter fuscus (strain ATCC 25194 / DSM 2262 / NBRC 100088 / M29) TaxID=1242864 RepID=S9QV88_CYSF2|nr:GreA/GreB family elongation factor [Cystobacter fuscus]EPX65259.1 Transcription elongation factor GreB [Cystobacter fuscus DSM 2262]
MSKAFTKEDAGGEDVVLPPRPRPASGEKRYITAEGYRAMQEELAALSVPLAPEEKEALALGGEGQARERARRARQLAAILEEVQVTEVPDETRVFFGAWVTLEDEEGEETTYRIVGPDEADVKAGRLSVESPLARALLGKEEGESVRVERPRGAIDYTVTQVSYRPPTS